MFFNFLKICFPNFCFVGSHEITAMGAPFWTECVVLWTRSACMALLLGAVWITNGACYSQHDRGKNRVWFQAFCLPFVNLFAVKVFVLQMQILRKREVKPATNIHFLQFCCFWAFLDSWKSNGISCDVFLVDGKRFIIDIMWGSRDSSEVERQTHEPKVLKSQQEQR